MADKIIEGLEIPEIEPSHEQLDQVFTPIDVQGKYIPPAPTNGIVDDNLNTFDFTPIPNYPRLDFYEYSRDFGKTWNPVVENPITGIERDHAVGQVRVRVKSMNGASPGKELFNEIPYTSAQEDLEQIQLEAQAVIGTEEESNKDADAIVTKYPVANLVHKILVSALELGASDIHIEPTDKSIPNSTVRFRIDGVMQRMNSFCFASSLHKAVVANIKNELGKGTGLSAFEKEKPQDGAARIKKTLYEKIDGSYKRENGSLVPQLDEKGNIKTVDIDARISILPMVYGEKIVIRLLDSSGKIPLVEEMGFNKPNVKKINDGLKMPQGLILVTGPTGAGKSTSMYSMLSQLNDESVCIITVENPVERKLNGIVQVAINEERGRTFEMVLRSILRQDPDILMIGEIRDPTSAKIALEAANTGHLVLSTLHMNFATDVVERLNELGISPVDAKQLGMTLIFVSGQRLARKLCKHCRIKVKDLKTTKAIKEEFDNGLINDTLYERELMKTRDILFSDEYKNLMIKDLLKPNLRSLFTNKGKLLTDEELKGLMDQKLENTYVHNPYGCEKCSRGYSGRVLVAEVFKPTAIERKLISETDEGLSSKLRESALNTGLITMQQDGFIKILQGDTDIHDILRVIKTHDN